MWDGENKQIGQVCCHSWEKTLPGQCSFHCTKPDSSAEKTTVHALLYEDYEELSLTRTIDGDTYATSRAMVTKRVIEVIFHIRMRRSIMCLSQSLSTTDLVQQQNASNPLKGISQTNGHVFHFIWLQTAIPSSRCVLCRAVSTGSIPLPENRNPYLLTPLVILSLYH